MPRELMQKIQRGDSIMIEVSYIKKWQVCTDTLSGPGSTNIVP